MYFRVPVASSTDTNDRLFLMVIYAAWTCAVIYLTQDHSVWRDEPRALSLALQSASFADLLRNPPGDGHPLVWFLVLRAAYSIVGTYAVIQIVSVVIAGACAWLILFRSPFPLVIRVLVVLGLPLFEYSVIARNYGISLLLMLVFAILVTKPQRNSALLAACLFLLANTNVHSTLVSAGLGYIWFTAALRSKTFTEAAVAVSSVLLGVAVCVLTVYPPVNDIATKPLVFDPLALTKAVLSPGWQLWKTGVGVPEPALSVLYVLTVACLGRRSLIVGASLSLSLLSLLSVLVYGADYRHQALAVSMLMTCYWIACRDDLRPTGLRLVPLGALLTLQVIYSFFSISAALGPVPHSQAKQAAAVIHRARLSDAIVISDPDYMSESLAQYLDNPLYSVREEWFTKALLLRHTPRDQMSLVTILDRARLLRSTRGRPVVILLGARLEDKRVHRFGPYSTIIDREGAATFAKATRRLARLRPARTDEEYDLFLLK